MFILDKESNSIVKIIGKTFHELGYKEREHLQEWIARTPDCLGEELLIIQKEFDGFNDTNERLDLLALDKSGSLVIIENKLDDTGKDVVWQALKYVSYCSTLTKQQITDIFQVFLDKYHKGEKASDKIVEFMDDKPFEEISLNEHDQRMILVAGNFRKEVTSTALWMLNHGISVQCFKAMPFQYESNIFLDIEQIIPVKEAADYIIKMADKAKEEQATKENSNGIKTLRRQFWSELLEMYNMISKQFQNINPTDDHWLSCGSGVSGVPFQFLITISYVAVQLNISKADRDANKKIFDTLYLHKDEIENEFGNQLIWDRLDEKKSCRIYYSLINIDIREIDNWDDIKRFLTSNMVKFEKALKDILIKVSK